MAAPTTPTPATPDASAEKVYLSSDTTRMLKMVDSGHFKQHPFGEFVEAIAEQLRLADKQINNTGMAGLHAEMKVDRAKKEMKELEGIVVRLQEEIRVLKTKVPVDKGDDCI